MGTNMRKESKKQSKFKHYILKKAKELYVKGLLMACSGSSAVSDLHAADHTNKKKKKKKKKKKNNVNTTTSKTNANGGERQSLREILRTAPINETRIVTNNIGSSGVVIQRQRIAGYKYNRNKMSYKTVVRKMGRIDEDRPCYFEEDESDHSISKASLVYLYPRTTLSVGRKKCH